MKKILMLLFCFSSILTFPQQKEFPKPQIEFNPKTYICYRAEGPLNIDGDLEDLQWVFTPWTDDFVDIEGDLKPKPYFRTRVKMLWDDQYLYIGAELEEPHVWGNIKVHDQVIYHDNDFEVFIDPDSDTHNYFEYEINALGTDWDLFLIKPYRDDAKVAVDGYEFHGLKKGVKVNGTINDPSDIDRNWTIEMAIPWDAVKQMAYTSVPPKENDHWKINFSRVQWRTEIKNDKYQKIKGLNSKPLPEHNWVWSPQGIIAMHYPEMWGNLQFSYKVIGYGKDEVLPNALDPIRWELRKIYYAQKTYYMNNGHFTNDLEELNLELSDNLKIKVQATTNLYEASTVLENKKITIYQDGLIRISEIKE